VRTGVDGPRRHVGFPVCITNTDTNVTAPMDVQLGDLLAE
jgi:hypothetical protein